MPAFFFRLIGWPTIVIFGQLILMSGAWSFLALIWTQKFIALSENDADLVLEHAHRVTLVFTLISTVLATFSSFLFSWGIRQSISIYLHRGAMSLGGFTSSASIASRNLVIDHRRLGWTVASIILLILTGIQTSGWSTLLTPQPIMIPTPIAGTELDLSSPLLRQMQASGALDYCMFESNALPAFSVGRTESGYASVKEFLEFPAQITFMDQTINVDSTADFPGSTAGILPLSTTDFNSTAFFNGTTSIPTTLRPSYYELPQSLSSNFSMIQQGFTTLMNCDFVNSTDPAFTANFTSDTVKDWNSGRDDGNITFSQLTSNCAAPANTGLNSMTAFTAGAQANYILMVGCQAGQNYTLIFRSSGTYDFLRTTVCTLTPQITAVAVGYSDTDSDDDEITISPVTQGDGVAEAAGGPGGLAAVTAIASMVSAAQGTSSNIMGDELNSLLEDLDQGDAFDDDDVMTFLELYINAVAEYSGSVLRACMSSQGEVFAAGVPKNMSVPSSGMVFTQTVGWQRPSITTILVLIPGTIIGLLTVIIVLTAVALQSEEECGYFDPINAMDLLSASAGGGLNDLFVGKNGEVEHVRIMLESIPGHRPVLVRQQYV
ncbi:hypothetical protein K438DRAFT_2023263 [Mycena galopus ATCC 62051]|nr:hypothetical protein K438DRAFT_2023263 [Mycena galopus ATCC 62051]